MNVSFLLYILIPYAFLTIVSLCNIPCCCNSTATYTAIPCRIELGTCVCTITTGLKQLKLFLLAATLVGVVGGGRLRLRSKAACLHTPIARPGFRALHTHLRSYACKTNNRVHVMALYQL